MPTMRCPQCGTEFEKGTVEFCPNPTCGYPLSFLEGDSEEQAPRPMERKPGEGAAPPRATPSPPPQPPPMPVQPVAPPPPRKPRSKLPVVLGGGVVLVAGAVVAVLLLTGDGDDRPEDRATGASPTATESPPTPTPTSTTEPPTDGEPPALAWQPLLQPAFAGAGNQAIRAVTAGFKIAPGETGYLAAGIDTSEGNVDGAVWLSEDGVTFERAFDDDLTGSGDQEINGLTLAGRRVIAVGIDSSGGDTDAAVWTSGDGLDWERVFDDDLEGEGNQAINRVAGSPFGQIAVGFDTSTGTADAAVWISQDGGRSWSRAEDPDGALGGPGDQVIRRVRRIESGVFTGLVAVGYDTSGGSDAAAWVSSDGTDWQRVPDDENVLGGEGDQQMVDLADFDDLLVGVGFDSSSGTRDGAVWVSENGVDWERIADPDNIFGGAGDQILTRAISPADADEGGIPRLIVGGVDTSGGDEDGSLWYSQDARTWLRDQGVASVFGGEGAQRIESMSAADGSLLVVGSDASREDQDAAAWTGSPAS